MTCPYCDGTKDIEPGYYWASPPTSRGEQDWAVVLVEVPTDSFLAPLVRYVGLADTESLRVALHRGIRLIRRIER